jgi:hypothetical protein
MSERTANQPQSNPNFIARAARNNFVRTAVAAAALSPLAAMFDAGSANAQGADQCPNINGVQLSVPIGQHKDASGNCVSDAGTPVPGTPIGETTSTPTVHDSCKNIPGIQTSVPLGYGANGNGECFPVTPPPTGTPIGEGTTTPTPHDACLNIDGRQDFVPYGYWVDGNGNCIPITTPTPTVTIDYCFNLYGIQTSFDVQNLYNQGWTIVNNNCYPPVTVTPTPFYPTPPPPPSVTATPNVENIQVVLKKRLDVNRNGQFDEQDQGLAQDANVWIELNGNDQLDNGEPAQSTRTDSNGVRIMTFSGAGVGTRVCAAEVNVAADLEPVIGSACSIVDNSRTAEIRLLNKNREVVISATPTVTIVKVETPIPPTPRIPKTGNVDGSNVVNLTSDEGSANLAPIILGGLTAAAGAFAAVGLRRKETIRKIATMASKKGVK